MSSVFGYAQSVTKEKVYGRLIHEKHLLLKDGAIIEIKPDTFESDLEIKVKEQNKALAINNRKTNNEVKKIKKKKQEDLRKLATPEMLGKYLAMVLLQYANGGISKEDEYTYEYEKEKALATSEYREVFNKC